MHDAVDQQLASTHCTTTLYRLTQHGSPIACGLVRAHGLYDDGGFAAAAQESSTSLSPRIPPPSARSTRKSSVSASRTATAGHSRRSLCWTGQTTGRTARARVRRRRRRGCHCRAGRSSGRGARSSWSQARMPVGVTRCDLTRRRKSSSYMHERDCTGTHPTPLQPPLQ